MIKELKKMFAGDAQMLVELDRIAAHPGTSRRKLWPTTSWPANQQTKLLNQTVA